MKLWHAPFQHALRKFWYLNINLEQRDDIARV